MCLLKNIFCVLELSLLCVFVCTQLCLILCDLMVYSP